MAQQRYHVIERIDAGGMAEVFKANSTSLQGFEKLVAIKRILPNLTKNERFIRMFLDEAKVSLHLNHTNTVQVFDLGLADGTYFIVMEFVDGTNLKNIIEALKNAGKDLTVEESAYIALEVCKGLSHAHGKIDQSNQHLGIVHRDISPPNILISKEGEVKITDFGLAKAKSQVETTDPGVVKGKFGYLSPEAAHGEEVDARTDIFAVGILMWEMLTAERLFLGNTDIETLQQVRRNQIPALAKYRSDVPDLYERIIHKALATDPTVRYQTARELAEDIARFLFQFGRPVTAFNVARHVVWAREANGPRERTEKDKAVEEAVQDAVNRIVSLEEVDDLDLYLADTFETTDSEGAEEWDGSGNFEDPRMWGDFGFDDAPVTVRESPVGDEAWQERGLDEIMRRRQTHPGGVPMAPPQGEGLAEDTSPPSGGFEAGAAPSVQPQVQPQVRQQQPMRAGAATEKMGPPRAALLEEPDRPSIEIAGDFAQQAQHAAQVHQPSPQAMPSPSPDATSELQAPAAAKKSEGGGNTAMLVVVVLLVILVAAGAAFALLS